jgi:ubiquinone/menaquinone biosynthesis C-methylase UbiE
VPPSSPGPPTHIRIIGRTLNATVAKAPWLWPLLRRRMQRYFDELAPGWDGPDRPGPVARVETLATAVTKVPAEPERILDIGTGTGAAALFLAREYPRASVRGVDFSEEMVKRAQKKIGLDPDGRVAFRVADAADLPFEADSFDLVTQINVPPFFGEIGRVLRPGGSVIVVASIGDQTPFYTPNSVLDRGFSRRGIERVETGEAGSGTYWIGRRLAP